VYLATVLLLMAVLPVGSVAVEHLWLHAPVLWLVGKWFVFWNAGVRLFVAGLRQFVQPRFTAEKIFRLKSGEALPIIRELGVANLATGTAGVLSLARADFVLPVAVIAALFYGIAAVRHAADRKRSRNQEIAMVSDAFVALVFAAYVGCVLLA